MTTTKSKNFNVKNIANGVLNYYLYSPIGIDQETGDGISGQHFANDIDFIETVMKDEVKQINIRINSGGGSIMDGLSMIQAIQLCSIPIDTYIDGIGASIAGVLAMAGRKRFMNDYSRIMIHDPFIDTANDLTDSDKVVLSHFKDMIKTILSNNSTHTADEIDSLMSVETWFTAEQAKSAGLIDSVVKTERNIGLMSNDSKSVYLFANEIFKRNIRNETKHIMKKLFNKLSDLKLIKNNETENDAEKVETLAVETIETLTAEKQALIDQVAEKDAKIAELETAKKSSDDTIAETAVDQAVNDGKIDVAKRVEMLAIAKNDIDAFNTMIGAMKVTARKVTDVIKNQAGNVVEEKDGMIDGKTLRQLEKTKDGQALIAKIRNGNPAMFEKLYFKQYGTKPSNI